MAEPMMPPNMWASGVAEPNYAQPLLQFQQRTQAPQGQQQPQGGMPIQGQSQQNMPGMQPRPPGIAGPMNSMANTMNGQGWAAALMKMFGGQQQGIDPNSGQPITADVAMAARGRMMPGANTGSPGGTNPFPGQSPIY